MSKVFKIGTFSDQVLDRQITALVNAANAVATPQEVTPSPPTGITATGRLFAIELSITFPRADNVLCEVWTSASNDRSTATLLGVSVDGSVQHQGLEAAAVRYYWARSVTTPSGLISEWYPLPNSSGIFATTSNDPTAMLKLLNGDIAGDKLASYLTGGVSILDLLDTHPRLFEVGNIGAGITATYSEALSRAASQMNRHSIDIGSLSEQVAGLVNIDYSDTTTYSVGDFVKYNGSIYQCIAAGTGVPPTSTTNWITSSGIVGLVSTVQSNLDTASASWSAAASSLTADLTGITTRLNSAESEITVSKDNINVITTNIVGDIAVFEQGIVEDGIVIQDAGDVPSLGLSMSRAQINLDTQTGRIDLLSTRVSGAEGRLSSAELNIDGALSAINLRATTAYVQNTYQSKSDAAIAMDAQNAAISLRATKTELDITNGSLTSATGELDVVKDRITMRLDNSGNITGMVMGWNNTDKSETVFITDVFKVCQPDGSGIKQAFVVGNVNGTTAVGVDGDMIVDGSISARSIAANQLIVGENVGMGTNVDLPWGQVTNAPNLSFIDNNGIYTGNISAQKVSGDITNNIHSFADDGSRYSALTKGDLTFYKAINGSWYAYKYMKQVISGIAMSGQKVSIPNMDRTPSVLVSLRDLSSYKKEYRDQDQRWKVLIDDTGIYEDPAGSGIYSFTPVAVLTLAANTGSKVLTDTVTGTSSNSLTSSTYTSPPNSVSISVSGTLNSTRSTGSAGYFQQRKCVARIYYRTSGTGEYTAGASTTVYTGSDLTENTYTVKQSGLASGTYDFYVIFTYSDDIGTFQNGAIVYDYSQNTISNTHDTSVPISSGYGYYSEIALPPYSVPTGWEIYQINYSVDLYLVYTPRNGDPLSGLGKYIPYPYFSSHPIYLVSGTLQTAASQSGANTYQTVNWQDSTLYNPRITVGNAYTIGINMKNAYALILLRKPQAVTTNPANSYTAITATFDLSQAQVIDSTGIVNWMAIA